MTNRWIEGGCLCGAVRFRIDLRQILLFNTCYCRNCQKNTGTGFTVQLQLDPAGFEWLSGEDSIAGYESSPDIFRDFCRTCGTRVPRQNPNGIVAVPAGAMDENLEIAPEINLFAAERRRWAAMDSGIESLPGQGSPEFWEAFMKARTKGTGSKA